MTSLPGDDKQRVLDATDIVRLIGEHVALRAKGREYVGLCPFHDDHSPSMCVVPAKQIYKCFSCGAGGDAITFVREYHKMGFREALEYLADRGGIKLTPWRPGPRAGFSDTGSADIAADTGTSVRATMLAANLTARDFFRAVLAHPEHGKVARDTIERRGISPEMVQQFELGASPNRWDGLCETITRKGLSIQTFASAGLVRARDEGSGRGAGHFDFFRNRLMFPIHDQIGRVVAFGARRLNDEDEPKYINSSESSVFNKSATLYGLHQAAQEIRRSKLAIVTEGYMDTIACHQAGVRNAVATLGTALTRDGARVLRRLCDTVVLLFDGDEAGQKAADRALEVFFAEPIDVRIAVMSSLKASTGAKDPDELLKQEGGLERFQGMIESAVGALDYRFARLRTRMDGLGLSARSRLIEDELARLADIGLESVTPIRRQLVMKQIAQLLGVDERTVVQAMPKARRSTSLPSSSPAPMPRVLPGDPRQHLLGCVLLDPSLVLSLEAGTEWVLAPESFDDPLVRVVAQALAQVVASGGTPDLRSVLASLADARAQAIAVALEDEVSRITDHDTTRVHEHWRDRLAEVLREAAWREASSSPPVADEDSWAPPDDADWSRLARLRELHQKVGAKRGSVPRPPSG